MPEAIPLKALLGTLLFPGGPLYFPLERELELYWLAVLHSSASGPHLKQAIGRERKKPHCGLYLSHFLEDSSTNQRRKFPSLREPNSGSYDFPSPASIFFNCLGTRAWENGENS